MKLTESSIKYPITVIVRVLLVAIFGYVCVTSLEVELKPDTSPPVLAIITEFPGAAPEEVEGEVKKVIEEISASGQRDVGRVMGEMMKRFKGRVDGRMVNAIVSKMLRNG